MTPVPSPISQVAEVRSSLPLQLALIYSRSLAMKIDCNVSITGQKERAQEIKRLQEQAVRQLPPGTLFIALWLRNDPPPPDDFHWAFYYHKEPRAGTVYQVRGLGGGWITDHGVHGCILKSLFLCCLVRIGDVPAAEEQSLDRIIRTRDSSLNEISNVTCKVWLFDVLPCLIQEGLMRCHDLHALEAECLEIANKFRFDASGNVQPRPVVTATTCSLSIESTAIA